MIPIEIDKEVFKQYPLEPNDEIWQKLRKIELVTKGTLPNNALCFLESGIIRKYYLNVRTVLDQELSLDFYLAGDIFATEHIKYAKNIHYEAIDNGTLWFVTMKEIKDLLMKSQKCNTYQMLFLEKQVRDKTIREIQRLKSTPQDLYLFLLEHKPEFIQSIPLKYLASYIGITPQALSRIRRRIS